MKFALLLLTACAMFARADRDRLPLLPLHLSGKRLSKPAGPRIPKAAVGQAVLCTLAVQNACQMLSMRYSRLPDQPKYLASTAVLLAEVVKILVSVAVAYQLKLLTTAFFTARAASAAPAPDVTLLKRHISLRRWVALGILFLGGPLSSTSPIRGMAAVTSACFLSGLAGVWLERIVPIWLRNVQLGSLSLLIGACQIAWLDGGAIRAGASLPGLHSAHTSRTASSAAPGGHLSAALPVSLGGLLVALVMKYADNVVKGFATSLSIVISSVVSLFIPSFNFSLRPTFLAGSTLVIAATILYSTIPASPKGAAKAPTPLHELSASEYERQL
ncbi:hypothetical protein EMIHUDRAFT_95469 [Emiliania huxleyi CCMP1516]|uniref:Nucleotide-sugar transporter n=2 Tax=Emiliania huxleyi TaxID=2903 RepID=A0A0D3JH68_EMIH1|nr:hypothetical protein EMIHUDRAFT_95469 [Emiliania huxleyi CCMP1516]EOD22853.1 hypothetical protein EMIHUDRAFT_95469 [Emiliania huxleyi CCMP1516]|eukprot:XP_005775282.1 hypothetical protein EMIHUDRAFT_95469 [Emiliania huxleyi CCMP1516]